MPVRSTMAALISSVRLLINDPAGSNAVLQDQDIQDVLDEGRQDVLNAVLRPDPTYTGSTIQFLDYFSDIGGWEDGAVLKQYLTIAVTPSLIEPIVGHFQFSTSILPPVMVTGRLFDRYRAAADLLERWAAKWVLRYDVSADGQSLHRSQAAVALQKLAHTYRMKQRPKSILVTRSDLVSSTATGDLTGRGPIDYMSSGDGR